MRNYSLRFSLLPSADFEAKMEALLTFCKDACIDDVMFFVSPEEVNTGHITLEEAKAYTDVILRAKYILKERGITISLNPWCTMSHYDGGRTLKEGQNFRTMVDISGVQAKRVACPLCENWRKYYVELLTFYVETLEPRILWFEDDMRYTSHDPIRLGCFCEEHMRRFNARLKTKYDRETFAQKLFTDTDVRKAYLDVLGDSIRETLGYIVEKIPEQKTFGLMTGGAGQGEGRKYGDIYAAMSENGKREKPYNRICLHSYRQRGMQEYAWAINENSMLTRKITGNLANCVSEMENFPHSLYTKTANYFRYQLLSTSMMGLTGDTLSIFEFNGNGIVNGRKYAEVLRACKPYLSRLSKLDLSPDYMVGVDVLINENSAYTTKNVQHFGVHDGWLFAYLEQIGVAASYTTDVGIKGRVVAVSGQVLRNYTPDEVRALFANNYVILTGDNIDALVDMGLQDILDIEGYETYEECTGKHAFEQIATDDEVLGIKNMRATAQFFCGRYYNIRYAQGGKEKTVFTNMCNYDESVVGKGIMQVGNALIFPFENVLSDQKVPISLLCPLREFAVKKALKENTVDKSRLYLLQEENVCMYVFDKGERVYMVFMNFVDDDYDHLHFEAPYLFDDLKIFTPDNDTVRYVSYVCENGKYRINHTLKAQQSYVLVGYKREVDLPQKQTKTKQEKENANAK